MLDTAGYYDPDLLDKDKERIIDSIYELGRMRNQYRSELSGNIINESPEVDPVLPEIIPVVYTKEIGLQHQLFFSSDPSENPVLNHTDTDNMIYAEVDGTQVVKQNYRLRMRLSKDASINGMYVPKNTPVFGFIAFSPTGH